MRSNRLHCACRSLIAAAAIVAVAGSSAFAAPADFNEGVKLFNQGNPQGAIQYFDRALKANPNDATTAYYIALSLHKLGRMSEAKHMYEQICLRFPRSQAAPMAQQALASLSAGATSQQSHGTRSYVSSGSGSEIDNQPTESRVYFQRHGKALIVDADVNGRPIKMLFDTGAEMCVFGKNHLAQLGIAPPTGQPGGKAQGVGSNATIPIWFITVDMKMGGIQKKNFQIAVQENLPDEPLMGMSFYRDFAYTIDNGANSILFQRKGGGQTASAYGSGTAVPFTMEGNSIIVNAEVNGKSMPMVFDTGADGIAFTRDQIRTLGIAIPDDAEQDSHTGISGTTHGYGFSVQRMRLGPIDKSNVRISVIENAAMRHPLLGQTMYSDWQYTIDHAHHQINFLRR